MPHRHQVKGGADVSALTPGPSPGGRGEGEDDTSALAIKSCRQGDNVSLPPLALRERGRG